MKSKKRYVVLGVGSARERFFTSRAVAQRAAIALSKKVPGIVLVREIGFSASMVNAPTIYKKGKKL